MKPDGSSSFITKALVIGEAPGEEEDLVGKPFVGRSGTLLRTAIDGIGLSKDDVVYTNIVRCRPSNNKISKVAINFCKAFAIQDIEEYKPKFVLLMGNSPLEGILGETGITNWNGIIIKKNGRKYLPLYHPAYILRNPGATDDWLTGFLSMEDSDVSSSEYKLVVPRNLKEVKDMQDELVLYNYIAYDTEVISLNPFSVGSILLAVSFAVPDKKFAVPIDHKDSWFKGNGNVKDIIINILKTHDNAIIGHNLKFDQMQSVKHLGVKFSGCADTMLISHMLDSRQGIHGLKRLAGVYCGMYGYDRELEAYKLSHPEANPDKGGNYGEIPLEILLPYAANDVEATTKLYLALYNKLTIKQKYIHEEMIMKFSDMLCQVQCNGVVLDSDMAHWYKALYNTFHDDMYQGLLSNKYVTKLWVNHKDKKGYIFNPNSSVQLSELYFDICKIPVVEYTPTGKRSTKAELFKIMEDKFPILYQVRQYKLLGKMLSTYLNPATDGSWLSNDGRVRSTYNLHGTKTSRISSSNPNLQNIPTPEKEPGTLLEYKPIKNVFTHSYINHAAKGYVDRYCDGVTLSADYSGAELRVFASLSRCKPMIDIHKSGKDFHSCIAIMTMEGKYPSEITMEDIKALPKAVRYIYKWTNWTLLYGGGIGTLISMYNIKEDKAKEAVKKYYELFPEVLEYREECIDFATTHGYIESPFGRIENLPDINSQDMKRHNKAVREAINMPTQSGASDLTLCSAHIVSKKIQEYKDLRSKIINTVHDSIVLDVPKNEIYSIAHICTDAMENIKTLGKVHFPHIDFDWLICPLKANIEIGTHYGSEIGLKEWVSLYG